VVTTEKRRGISKMEGLSRARGWLLGCLITLLVLVGMSVFAPAELTAAVRWISDSDVATRTRNLSQTAGIRQPTQVEMVVDRVAISELTFQPVVVLKAEESERSLPILVGRAEATAIAVALEGVQTPRPLTADLLRSTLDRLGARLDSIVVNDLQDDIFYASMVLEFNWKQEEVDCRPSDAIALALRVGAPIFVEESVLEKAGTGPDLIPEKRTLT
jgi:bifunctional DNase/RNase